MDPVMPQEMKRWSPKWKWISALHMNVLFLSVWFSPSTGRCSYLLSWVLIYCNITTASFNSLCTNHENSCHLQHTSNTFHFPRSPDGCSQNRTWSLVSVTSSSRETRSVAACQPLSLSTAEISMVAWSLFQTWRYEFLPLLLFHI